MAAKKKATTKAAAPEAATPLSLDGIVAHGGFEQVAVDGRAKCIVTAQRDRAVRAHDVAAGTERVLGRHTRRVQALAVDGAGRWAVSAGGETTVWNLKDKGGRRVADLSGVMSVAAAGRGTFVTAGSDGVALVDASGACVSRKLDPFDGLAATSAVAAGGRIYAGSESGNVACVEARSGRVLWTRRVGSYPVAVALDADGGRLVVAMSSATLLSAETGAVLARSKGGVECIATLGAVVLSGGYDGTLRAWNADTGLVSRIGVFKYAVMSLAVAAKARVAVAVSGKQLQGWSLA